MLRLTFPFALLCLAGCSTASTRSVVINTEFAAIPLAARVACPDPVTIPASAASNREEQWRLWGRDRKALANCRDRHAVLAKGVEAIEGQGAK